jgi:hypothetical protein
MTPNEEAPPSPERQTVAEIAVLRSADAAGRIPFPQGSYRDIATYLEAITQLEKRGYLEHRIENDHFGCYLTEAGKALQSDLVGVPSEQDNGNSREAAQQPPRSTRATVALLLGLLLLHTAPARARLGESPDRVEARYGPPVKVENGVCSRDFERTYRHAGLTIVVHFLDEKSQCEVFANDSGEPLVTNEVQHLLDINRGGGKWTVKSDGGMLRRWRLNSGEAMASQDYNSGLWLQIETVWWEHFVGEHRAESPNTAAERLKDF